MNFYVYILFSESTNKHYIGQTNNVDNRLFRHNSGYEKYTKKGKPWTLKFYVTVDSRTEALKLEKKLKNMKSAKLLNQWIDKMRVVLSYETRSSNLNVNDYKRFFFYTFFHDK